MHSTRIVCFLALICMMGGLFLPTKASAHPALQPAFQQVCTDAQAEFLAHPGWLSELRDPILTSAAEIRERINRYGVLFRCMSSGGIEITGEMVEVNRLVTLFMLFAGGSLFPEAQAEARNYTLTFSDIQDPAVKAIRDELGIPAPPGYIYIWLYPSRGSMPKALREYATDASIRGLTLQSRYIVVFDSVQVGTPLEEYERSQRAKVLSHEFVHAYIKSYLGPQRGFSLPTWFDEGLAIYLSGSSEPSSAAYFDQNGRQVTWSIPPANYARYRDDFNYLEQELGRDRLMALIRRSILENAPDTIIQAAGQASEDELYQLAEASRIRRGLTRIGLFVGIPAVIGVVILAARAMLKRKKQFGVGTPVQLPRQTSAPESELSRLVHQLGEQSDNEDTIRKRYFAALALARWEDQSAVEALLGALNDECTVVRAAAARGLGEWSLRMPDSALLKSRLRGEILNGLFAVLDRDPANEARWAAAEAFYQVSGESALRPIRAAVRRWSRDDASPDSALHQTWYVQWLAAAGQAPLLVDAYSWSLPAARQAVITHLRGLPAAEQDQCLSQVRESSDQRLRELPELVRQAN
jgi:HEAT repeat protein